MPGDWSGNVQMTDDAAKAVFADAQVGQVIRVAVKDVAAGAQGSFKNSGWSEIASGTDYFDISGVYIGDYRRCFEIPARRWSHHWWT